jgi:hypothetical protein
MKVRSFLLFFIVLISFFGCKEVVYIEDPDVNSTAVSKVTIKFDANGGQGEMPSQKVEKSVSTQINRNIFTKSGFKFTNWNTAGDGSGQNFEDSSFVKFDSDKTLYAMWLPEDAVIYKVEHYQQNIEDDEYSLVEADTETKKGTIGTQTEATAKSYEGFSVNPFEQKTILSNGSTTVKIYYTRNVYTVTFNANGGILSENSSQIVKYNGKIIELTSKEYDLLYFLLGKKAQKFSRDEILYAVWGNDYTGSNRVVDDLMRRLRNKLPHLRVETLYGYGYRLL